MSDNNKDEAIYTLVNNLVVMASWLDGEETEPFKGLCPSSEEDRKTMAALIRHELYHVAYHHRLHATQKSDAMIAAIFRSGGHIERLKLAEYNVGDFTGAPSLETDENKT